MISIIIVNFNWKKWLKKCISSLLNQTYKDFEIIFVDNASSDDSIEYIEKTFNDTRIKIIKNKNNSWFSWGNNLGYQHASGEYIILLNNDTRVENNFLEKYIYEFQNNDIDILGVTERKYNGEKVDISFPKIDLFWHPITLKSNFKSHLNTDLFYTSWVCIIFKKDFYEKTWWLDNNFFMYVEEVDWMWRCRLYGYKIWQLTNLFIYHAGAGSTWSGIKYNVFLWRNQNTLQMLLKNYSGKNLLWILPIYLCQNIWEIFAFTIFWKFKIASSYISGWIFNIKNRKIIFKNRKEIQEKRIISDKEIMKNMYKGFWKINHLITYFKQNN